MSSLEGRCQATSLGTYVEFLIDIELLISSFNHHFISTLIITN